MSKLKAWWAHRQGLDGAMVGATAEAVLSATGWSRSVGGATPYLALFARAGLTREQVDEAVAKVSICELPAARGCTYVVPQSDFGLALQAGRKGKAEPADVVTARRLCGFSDEELDRLCRSVLKALEGGPKSPDEIKQTVGTAVRSLGEAGKKKGLTTTLPIALGYLQGIGRIRRVPTNGRLDQQRYRYARWEPAPTQTLSQEQVNVELARRFYRWAGPAAPAQFVKWSGLTVKAARAAIAELKLVPFDGDPERLILPERLEAYRTFRQPTEPCITLVGSLDNIIHLSEGSMPGPDHHIILDRGASIGFWDYDPTRQAIVWKTSEAPTDAVRQAVARTEAYVRDHLGDARTFSLDSPDSRQPRLAALR